MRTNMGVGFYMSLNGCNIQRDTFDRLNKCRSIINPIQHHISKPHSFLTMLFLITKGDNLLARKDRLEALYAYGEVRPWMR